MSLLDSIRKIKYGREQTKQTDSTYEFCPRCDANLTLQKGYSNELPYWNCRGCGEMLINPAVDAEDDIVWVCDKCEAMLNLQPGFAENTGHWTCCQCGHDNKIDLSEIYLSEDEYQNAASNPYRGLSDDDMLELSSYEELYGINNREDIIVVRSMENDRLYVKKILSAYDPGVFMYLLDNPVENMPKICSVFQGENNLIVIEEYIEGRTLADIINERKMDIKEAAAVCKKLAEILRSLHRLEKPIIHRDVKPSNVLLTAENELYLLDVNISKWYKQEESEDTRLMGTPYFAAPEQLGYGFAASSEKADIYAVGMLLNMMITGRLPKEEKATGRIWEIVERCIRLEAGERYTDDELIAALNALCK